METKPPRYPKSAQIAIAVGLGLILFGLFKVLELFSRSPWWTAILKVFNTLFSFAWPVVLIGAGIFLVWAARKGKFKGVIFDSSRPFRRSVTDKRISGLCGGIAQYLSIDSTVIRVLAVILLVVSPVFTLIVYVFASIIVSR